MKKIALLLITVMSLCSLFAQSTDIPSVTLKDLNGKDYNINKNCSEKLVIITFWATWCSPCLKELAALDELYADWKAETGVEIIAVSVDDARTAKRVKPVVSGKAWDFTILMDTNQDLKRKMNVGHPPYTFLIYQGKIVYQHSGYTEGSEKQLYEELKKYSNKN